MGTAAITPNLGQPVRPDRTPTRRGDHRVASPTMSTLDRAAVDALLTRARREVDDGLLPACQLAIGLEGEIVLEETFGDATSDTRFTIYSATKPFVASVIWQLLGEGQLDPSRAHRRPDPRVRHQREGRRHPRPRPAAHLRVSTRPPRPVPAATHEGRREAFAAWRLDWEVGSRFEYHATSAHWVLAEVIHAVTGVDHTEAVRRRVARPPRLGRLRPRPARRRAARHRHRRPRRASRRRGTRSKPSSASGSCPSRSSPRSRCSS